MRSTIIPDATVESKTIHKRKPRLPSFKKSTEKEVEASIRHHNALVERIRKLKLPGCNAVEMTREARAKD